MRSILDMSPDEVAAEAERRRELQRRGLPFDAAIAREFRCNKTMCHDPKCLDCFPAPAIERADDDERLEKAIEHTGDKQMRALGFEVVKFSHPGRTKQTPGIPDRRYYHRARKLALWWEAKSATGRQRPDQRWFQEMCEATGEIYVLGTDRDLFTWLVEHRVAAWTVGDLLVALPFTDYTP